jgi:hypothetical protein
MYFLYPYFLFALSVLAIPVLIHLFNFRRYQKIYFSNVQFLKEIQEQQSSRRNLKERLILAARLLALLFLVVAFAKPYIRGQNTANAGKQQAISIFVDNSWSMSTLNRDGSLLDEAKRRAKEIAAAYSINDRFQLLTQDFEGRHQRLLSRDEFDDAVDTIKISPQTRDLQQIITRQEALLTMHREQPGAIFIVSDFQTNMGGPKPVKTDTGLNINLVQLTASSLPNVAVDSVALLNAIHRPGESEKMIVRLHNYSDQPAEKIPLKLVINKQQKALGSYTINARAVQYDTLTFSGLQAGWQRGEITLQDNPVTFDNQFYFTFQVKQQMPVLLIDGGTANPYLKAVFAADPFFDAHRVPDGNVDYASLNNYPLIILSDINAVSTGLSQQLKSYVDKGGVLAVFPSTGPDLVNYKAFLSSVQAGYPEKLITANTKVAALNMQNQVFKGIFENFPQNPDLPAIKEYFQLSTGGNLPENLMALPGKAPFWTDYTSGKGKVYVSAVPLNEDFSNLPRHALFVPVMFRIALLSGHDQPLDYTVGKNASIEVPLVQTSEKQVLKLTKGGLSIIPETRQVEGSTLLYMADELQQSGIYDLNKQDSTIAVLAFNDNRSESDLTYMDAVQLAKLVPHARPVIEPGYGSLKNELAETNFGVQLWKLCIILTLIFLGAEILLIRYFKTDLQPETQQA